MTRPEAEEGANPLAEYNLVVVGRYVHSDGDRYYMPEQRYRFLKSLAEPFASATVVCYVLDLTDNVAVVPMDRAPFTVVANETWNSSASLPRRLASLRKDARAIEGDRTVVYTYYPGTYSFLLAPAVLRRGDVNAAYFGKAAEVSAQGLENGRLVNRLQRTLYPRAERYVVNRSDVVFVRDPRVEAASERTSVVFSKPVTDALGDVDLDRPIDPIDPPVDLLYVGSFRPTKGHEYLVDALDHLRQTSDVEYRLRLVGDGRNRDDIEQMVRESGVDDLIEFLGHIEDTDALLEEYERSDVFVLPSETEGFPRVLTEAMSVGLPVVATKVGGIPSVLADRETAILVDPRDPVSLATGIRQIVADEERRERLVRNALEFATDRSGDPVDQHLDTIRRSLQ